MKAFNLCVAIAVLLTAGSCQKGEVPDSHQKYIGSWKNIDQTDQKHQIVINGDGTAEYHGFKTSGATYKQVDVTGYIFFSGYDFKIGSKHLVGMKFKADQPPKKTIISMKPYTYSVGATFNGVDYKKE